MKHRNYASSGVPQWKLGYLGVYSASRRAPRSIGTDIIHTLIQRRENIWDIMPLYSPRKRIMGVIFKNVSLKVHFSQAFSFSSPSVSVKCFPTYFCSFTFHYTIGYLQRSEINPAWISAYSSLNLHYSHNSRSPLN